MSGLENDPCHQIFGELWSWGSELQPFQDIKVICSVTQALRFTVFPTEQRLSKGNEERKVTGEKEREGLRYRVSREHGLLQSGQSLA